jgi:hypothetical protein
MPDVVRRLVERRAAQLVVRAAAGGQEMTHAPALRGGFPRWRAEARLPSDRLRPARRQRVTEGIALGLVLEQLCEAAVVRRTWTRGMRSLPWCPYYGAELGL